MGVLRSVARTLFPEGCLGYKTADAVGTSILNS